MFPAAPGIRFRFGAVDRSHPGADQGIEGVGFDPVFGEEGFNAPDLAAGDIHHEQVRRVLGQLRPPVLDQIGSQQAQDQQRHDRDRKHHHLQHVLPPPPAHRGHRQLPGVARLHSHRTAGGQEQQGNQRKQEPGASHANHEQGRQHEVPAVPVNQQNAAADAEGVGDAVAETQLGQILAQNPQRGCLAQREQGRQGEGEQADEGGEGANHIGLEPGRRQFDIQTRPQGPQDALVQRKAEQRAEQHRRQREFQLDQQINRADAGRGAAEGLENRHIVIMPLAVAAGAEGDGQAREQHREQRAEQQIAFGAVERFGDFPAFLAHVADVVIAIESFVHPLLERIEGGEIVVGEQCAVADAAAGLNHIGGGDIVHVQHQPRAGVVNETALAPVGFGDDHRAHGQLGFTDEHRPADLDTERGQGPGFEPDLPRRRAAGNRRAAGERQQGGDQFAAQGIRIAHRLGGDEHVAAVGKRHRGEGQRARGAETAAGGLVDDLRRGGLSPGVQYPVGGEHIGRLQQQRPLEPVGEQRDAGYRGHREHQRKEKQPQLAAAPVAPQQAPGNRGQIAQARRRGFRHGPAPVGFPRWRFHRPPAGCCGRICAPAAPRG